MPIIDNWLTNNFTLEIIRAKVAANKANASVATATLQPSEAPRHPLRTFRLVGGSNTIVT